MNLDSTDYRHKQFTEIFNYYGLTYTTDEYVYRGCLRTDFDCYVYFFSHTNDEYVTVMLSEDIILSYDLIVSRLGVEINAEIVELHKALNKPSTMTGNLEVNEYVVDTAAFDTCCLAKVILKNPMATWREVVGQEDGTIEPLSWINLK